MMRSVLGLLIVLVFTRNGFGQDQAYPRNYFRHPLNIPMQLVANFGEIRANHWHMGLDIRTQQKVNLPVFAAADGYISRVSVEAGSFGQAIYITHPNGFTTLYGHLNSFYPALASYVKQQQYERESWNVQLFLPPGLFQVKKGDQIALSGSTGASEGPHVHFEIRDTKTENCLNPLLFGFPIADGVPPVINRLALYDRNVSTYSQSPRLISIKRNGSSYTIAGGLLKTGSRNISFAIGAVDYFTGSSNPNGIYSAQLSLDGEPVTGFTHDDISYNDTRYINAQLDYPYHARGGAYLQHLSPLPGAAKSPYSFKGDGNLHLNDDQPHQVLIQVKDPNGNTAVLRFIMQFDANLPSAEPSAPAEQLLPGHVNIFERENFELYTGENTLYDTVSIKYSEKEGPGGLSVLASFLNNTIPVHDSISVRLRAVRPVPDEQTGRLVVVNHWGERTYVSKGTWTKGWILGKFRQFGTFEAFYDNEPPQFKGPSSDLSRASRIVITPTDNFNAIASFRAELDGKWLRFTNDKGRSWIYSFDENFPRGNHELRVVVTDVAGNITDRTFQVKR